MPCSQLQHDNLDKPKYLSDATGNTRELQAQYANLQAGFFVMTAQEGNSVGKMQAQAQATQALRHLLHLFYLLVECCHSCTNIFTIFTNAPVGRW